MKVQLSLAIYLLFLLPVPCNAQGVDGNILFTVSGRPAEAGEFIRMYRKGSDTAAKAGVDDYLQQYINFKLKVADAINMGYDTARSFRTELDGYRKQLAQNYLTDPEVKEKLLRSAYDRYMTEVSAMHILTAVASDASPADTLAAWNKSIAIRGRIVGGEPFDKIAREASDDPSAKQNGGTLGYFTAFQMITPFEDAAYKLNPGEISGPVRTPYGYHIIKVADKRPSRGRSKVAHIMKAAPPGTSDEDVRKAEMEINRIYDQLQSGAQFSELALTYSDHKQSAVKGGELGWFGTGEIMPEFSEAAFSIPDTGKYSKPFRTIYGWHILKLLERQKPGTFEETRKYLESRISPATIEAAGRTSFISKLRQQYSNSAVGTMSDADLLQYEDKMLEVKYPEFRYLMNEFHDGILMFEVSEKMVWNKTDENLDEAGQKKLEDDWVKQLRGKYNVKIDSSVLKEVKKKLTDE